MIGWLVGFLVDPLVGWSEQPVQVRVLSARLYTVINYVCQLVGGWVSWWVGWFVKGMFNQAVGWLVGQLVGTLVRRTNA